MHLSPTFNNIFSGTSRSTLTTPRTVLVLRPPSSLFSASCELPARQEILKTSLVMYPRKISFHLYPLASLPCPQTVLWGFCPQKFVMFVCNKKVQRLTLFVSQARTTSVAAALGRTHHTRAGKLLGLIVFFLQCFD